MLLEAEKRRDYDSKKFLWPETPDAVINALGFGPNQFPKRNTIKFVVAKAPVSVKH